MTHETTFSLSEKNKYVTNNMCYTSNSNCSRRIHLSLESISWIMPCFLEMFTLWQPSTLVSYYDHFPVIIPLSTFIYACKKPFKKGGNEEGKCYIQQGLLTLYRQYRINMLHTTHKLKMPQDWSTIMQADA